MDDGVWHSGPCSAFWDLRILPAAQGINHPRAGAPWHLLRFLLRHGVHLCRGVLPEGRPCQRARIVQRDDSRRRRAPCRHVLPGTVCRNDQSRRYGVQESVPDSVWLRGGGGTWVGIALSSAVEYAATGRGRRGASPLISPPGA